MAYRNIESVTDSGYHSSGIQRSVGRRYAILGISRIGTKCIHQSAAKYRAGREVHEGKYRLCERTWCDGCRSPVDGIQFRDRVYSIHCTKWRGPHAGTGRAILQNIVGAFRGNTTGITMPYRNAISEANGRPYIHNGGNFHYADLVGQYLVAGTGNQEVINGDVQHLLDVSKHT